MASIPLFLHIFPEFSAYSSLCVRVLLSDTMLNGLWAILKAASNFPVAYSNDSFADLCYLLDIKNLLFQKYW